MLCICYVEGCGVLKSGDLGQHGGGQLVPGVVVSGGSRLLGCWVRGLEEIEQSQLGGKEVETGLNRPQQNRTARNLGRSHRQQEWGKSQGRQACRIQEFKVSDMELVQGAQGQGFPRVSYGGCRVVISFGGEEGEGRGSLWDGWLSGRTRWRPHLSLLEDFIGLSRSSGGHHDRGGKEGSKGE